MALAFVAVVAFAGLPFLRVLGVVLAPPMALLSLGLWRRWTAAVVLGIVVGGFAVWVGVPTLLAAGDDAYEQVPSAYNALVPAITFGLGVMLLVGSAASVVRTGRVGQIVAAVALVLGVVLSGVGVWRLLEPQRAPGAGSGVEADCGSAFEPPSYLAGASGRCWEVLSPARTDGRQLLALGATLGTFGLGLGAGQVGRRAWPWVSITLGVVALVAAWATASMPLQSVSCLASNESYTGPVCDGLRQGLTGVTVAYLVAGIALWAVGLTGLVRTTIRSGRSARGRPS
jgi:hypothetical protein